MIFYNIVQKQWGPRAYLLYANTDSLVIRLPEVKDFEQDLEAISQVLDLSTLPKDHKLYDPNATHGEGKWKLEAYSIRQFLSMRQKSYSILEEITHCNCNHGRSESCVTCVKSKSVRKQRICHFKYLSILEKKQNASLTYKSVSHDKSGNLILRDNTKEVLSITQGNRVWVSHYESIPKGYRGFN